MITNSCSRTTSFDDPPQEHQLEAEPCDRIKLAVIFGMLAALYSLTVLYPSRHTGFTGTPALIAFKVIKATALFSDPGQSLLSEQERG
jgi:hypothetical protein